MRQAIVFFFNLLVLVIIAQIFAPGLAAEVVELLTNVVELANEALQAVNEAADEPSTFDTF